MHPAERDTQDITPPDLEPIFELTRTSTHENVLEAIELGPTATNQRIDALDREWPVERVVELGATVAGAVGVALGVTKSARWLALSGLAVAVLAQEALFGRSIPNTLLQRAGFRERREIDIERNALKALRGDFRRIAPSGSVHPNARATQALIASKA